jgi:hypothetical protein
VPIVEVELQARAPVSGWLAMGHRKRPREVPISALSPTQSGREHPTERRRTVGGMSIVAVWRRMIRKVTPPPPVAAPRSTSPIGSRMPDAEHQMSGGTPEGKIRGTLR